MNYCHWIILVIIVYVIILYFTRKYFSSPCEKVIDIITMFISVFVGAFFAIQLTTYENNKEAKEHYISLLQSEIKLDSSYIKLLQNSENREIKQNNHYYEYLLFQNIREPFILKEIINKGYISKFSSSDFKNWLPQMIANKQLYEFSTSTDDTVLLKSFHKYLSMTHSFINIEIEFLKDEINNDTVVRKFLTEMGSVEKDTTFEMNNIVWRSVGLGDSIKAYEQRVSLFQSKEK